MQVTEETKQILEQDGYEFEYRGEIDVKGKGMMRTWFLTPKCPQQKASSILNGCPGSLLHASTNGDAF